VECEDVGNTDSGYKKPCDDTNNKETCNRTEMTTVTMRNPIYLFYESVKWNSNGDVGNPGDKHYKCLHRNMKILTVTKKMKYSLNGESTVTRVNLHSLLSIGLIGNLRSVSAPMYRLYLTMKECPPNQITAEAVTIASGKKVLDPGAMSEFLHKLESANTTIRSVFEKQVKAAAVSGVYLSTPIVKLTSQRVHGIRKTLRTC
jgi:hypothetical protein